MRLIAAIRMKNEEWIIKYTLSALSEFVDGIVIVDDGSVDRSVEIAKSYEKVVDIHINRPKDENDIDEPRDWNKLTSMAVAQKADWILYTDADEMIEPSIKNRLESLLCRGDVGVYQFRKVSPWKGISVFRTDQARYNHPAKNVLNPILVKCTSSLLWDNGRGGVLKKLAKRIFRGERFKPNYGRVFPSGVKGKTCTLDEVVSIHFNHVCFDKLLKKQVFYALREKEVRPDKSRDFIIEWVARGWSEEGMKTMNTDPDWFWDDYLHFIEYKKGEE